VTPGFYELLKVDLSAWRGAVVDTQRNAEALAAGGAAVGSASPAMMSRLALATLAVARGRYQDALTAVRPVIEAGTPGWACQMFAPAVEAGLRAGDSAIADHALHQLEERASRSGTRWALGLLERCRALAAGTTDGAEAHFLQAIDHLERTSVATELAHAHLLYGEWLRRQKRRQDPRRHLRIAVDSFSSMGAEAFARRARTELAATGEKVRGRTAGDRNELTPQEAQVARLAATGATNQEIAAQLFISANTVDYHLRNVYRKLGIGSRRQLPAADSRSDDS
jgi:DNA-binding CsgD family transcriptional regulator